MLFMSDGNATSAYISLAYFSSKVDRDRELSLLFLDSLLEWGRTSYYADYKDSRKRAIIDIWIIRLARTDHNYLNGKITLGCL